MKISRLTQRFVRSLLRAFAAVAIVAKLLVPAGYMPGSLAAGLPVQLCDAGFAPVVLHAHAHEHAGHDAHAAHAQGDGTQHGHDAAGELHWKYCPSGALAAAGATAVVQPGGSVKDAEVIAAADLLKKDWGIEADIWKIEGIDKREDCEMIAEQTRAGGRDGVGCVVLGRGADDAKVDHWLRTGAGAT